MYYDVYHYLSHVSYSGQINFIWIENPVKNFVVEVGLLETLTSENITFFEEQALSGRKFKIKELTARLDIERLFYAFYMATFTWVSFWDGVTSLYLKEDSIATINLDIIFLNEHTILKHLNMDKYFLKSTTLCILFNL